MSKKKKQQHVTRKDPFGNKKNVLLIMADEFRFPIAKEAGGMTDDLKNILGFQNVNNSEGTAEQYISEKARKLFPGFMKLRENSAILKNHTVATTACVPSRAAMFTGQYGTKNKVTQTDGVFKGASEDGFTWLDPKNIPTIGDWFRANEYATHYFGKCHFAHPEKQSLKKWGFDDWETSFPEPHGTMKNNLGMYRDHGFTDLVTTFLRRKGMALDYDQEVGRIELTEMSDSDKEDEINRIVMKPWLAVASFTNPHDITTWPVLPAKAQDHASTLYELIGSKLRKDLKPLGIPEKGTLSSPPKHGTWRFDMNPGGIDSSFASAPNSWNETLEDKPDCQFDYSIKLGLALAAKTGNQEVANNSAAITGVPLTLANSPKEWTDAYIQYYAYLHHVLDQQIHKVLQTLEDTGLRDDTIVVFVPDHGEYGGSHGMMMQKWHSAYQEAIHVPVVVSMPSAIPKNYESTPKEINALTSHIDIAPSLLGLTGVTAEEVEKLRQTLQRSLFQNKKIPEFVGADLSGLIAGDNTTVPDRFNRDGSGERKSILFTTSDMITEPIVEASEESKLVNTDNEDYLIYLNAVNAYMKVDNEDLTPEVRELCTRLKDGPVVQPAEVHCVRQDNWKLVRYRDFHDQENESKFQWELYDLDFDPEEIYNLLKYDAPYGPSGGFVANLKVEYDGLDAGEIEAKAEKLYDEMLGLIEDMLTVEEPVE